MRDSPQNARLGALAERLVAEAGLELVKWELKGAGAGRVLRLYVDQPGGVGLNDCERVSRALSAALDAEEGQDALLPGAYTLEVSSPGLDRPLVKPEDFDRFAGRRAKLRAQAPVEGSRSWTGILEGGSPEGVRLQPDAPRSAAVTIAWDNLAEASLAPLAPKPAARR